MLSGTATFLATLPALPRVLKVTDGGSATKTICGSEFLSVQQSAKKGEQVATQKEKLPTASQDVAAAIGGSGVFHIKAGRLVSTAATAVAEGTALPQEFSSLLAASPDGKNIQIMANDSHVAVLSNESGLLASAKLNKAGEVVTGAEWTVTASLVEKKATGTIVASAMSTDGAAESGDSQVALVRSLEEGGFQVYCVSLANGKSRSIQSSGGGRKSTGRKSKQQQQELFSTQVTSGTVKAISVSGKGDGAILWSDESQEGSSSPSLSLWGATSDTAFTFPVAHMLQQSSGGIEDDEVSQYTAQEDPLCLHFASTGASTSTSHLLMLLRKVATNEVILVEYQTGDLLKALSTDGSGDLLLKRQPGVMGFPSSGPTGTGKLRSFVMTKMSTAASSAVVVVQRQLYTLKLKAPTGAGGLACAGGGSAGMSVMEQALLKLSAAKSAAPKSSSDKVAAAPIAVVAGINVADMCRQTDSGKNLQTFLANENVHVLRDSLFAQNGQHLVLDELLSKKAATKTVHSKMCNYLEAASGVSLSTKLLFLAALIRSSPSLHSSTGMVAPTPELINLAATVIVASNTKAHGPSTTSGGRIQTTEVAVMIKKAQKAAQKDGDFDAATCASLVSVLYPLTLHVIELAPHVRGLVSDCVQLTDAIFVANQITGGGNQSAVGGSSSSFWKLLPKQLPHDFQHLFQVVGHWCMSEPGTHIGQLTVNCGPDSTARKEPSVVEQVAYKVNTSHSTRITREVLTLPKQ